MAFSANAKAAVAPRETFRAADLKIHPVDIKKIKPARPGEF